MERRSILSNWFIPLVYVKSVLHYERSILRSVLWFGVDMVVV